MTTANIVNTKVVFAETTVSPYYDDFSEDKNFNRILFRPGYAVQARELTQIQTIMQNQIERFGNHIFQNGSIVAGGQISTTGVITLNLEPKFSGTDVVALNFLNDRIRYSSGNNVVEAYVVGTLETSDTGSTPALSVKYISGSAFSNTDNIRSVTSNSYASISRTNDYYSSGLSASIQDSIFFMNGYFIKVPAQTIIVDPFTPNANAKVGLEINQSVVTENSDNSLLDPAQESSNYQAPGAARLKVQLNLTKRSLDSIDEESFVELMRIDNGVIKKKVQYAIYSALGDELARRTYDESGNYTVRPFNISINDNSSNSQLLQISLSPGKAYVNGYETETLAEELIDLNRATDTDSVSNYKLGLNYGNYITVSNVSSNVDFTSNPIVDIHCLKSGVVDKTSSITYSSSKIGTAKIRNLSYSGPTTAVSNTPLYNLSLFDLRFNPITSNGKISGSVSNFYSNNYSLVTLADSNLSATSNAYIGATFRIFAGTGSGYKGNIVNYTNSGGSNRVFLVNSVIGTMDATSNVSIDFDFDEAESIISASGYTPGVATPTNGTLNADIDSGPYYPTLTNMVFKFPQNYIKENSLADQQYTYVKNIPVTFVGGSATGISALTAAKENYNNTGDNQNFMVFAANGSPLVITSVSDPTTDEKIDITLNFGYSGTATLYAVVNLKGGGNVSPKKKSLTTGNITTFSSAAANATITATTTGEVTAVYMPVGQATISNFDTTPSAKHSLYVSDVKSITAIYDMNGGSLPSSGGSLTSYTNIIDKFSFDNGQRDSHYDHASITLKPKVGNIKGPLVVCFDWYDHIQGATEDGLGYFSVDSYPNVSTTAGYTDIPVFIDSKGVSYNLRDCIDFRPKRQNLVSTDPNFTLQGSRIPNIFTNYQADYEYYLPRRSLLTMVPAISGQYPFIVIDGKSSLTPAFPSNLPGAMPLYKLTLEPYTGSKSNVKIEFIENKRYTMRDIGTLEKRIDNLEYYQSLSLLEKSATDMLIKDVNGLDRTKNGIIVDDFTTHGIGDVNNPDYYIAMDKVYGVARAPQQATPMDIHPDETTISGIKENKKYITLRYTEETFIQQPAATKYIPVNPYMYAAYVGKIVMEPESDYWVDTTKAPDLVLNFGGENDIVPPKTKTLRTAHANSNSVSAKVNTAVHGLGYGLWLNGLGKGYGTTNGSISWSTVFQDYNKKYTGNNSPLTQLSGFWNNHLGTPNR
jgi:hypothetical protein